MRFIKSNIFLNKAFFSYFEADGDFVECGIKEVIRKRLQQLYLKLKIFSLI